MKCGINYVIGIICQMACSLPRSTWLCYYHAGSKSLPTSLFSRISHFSIAFSHDQSSKPSNIRSGNKCFVLCDLSKRCIFVGVSKCIAHFLAFCESVPQSTISLVPWSFFYIFSIFVRFYWYHICLAKSEKWTWKTDLSPLL